MKTIQLISATVLLAAAGGAFAAFDDGAPNTPWQQPAPTVQQAPAPAAAAAPATSPLVDTRTQIVQP